MEQNANAMPQAVLGQYKGLAITRKVRAVSEKAVEQEVQNQARIRAPFVPTTEAAKRGSRVTLDFEGFIAGDPIPDSKMENVTVVLGTGELMPAAEEAVYGHKAGEVFRFDFTYPENFRVEDLSGKAAQFEIRLHSVEDKQAAAADDAFARSCGFDSLEAYKESIRARKRASHELNADRIAGSALLEMAGRNLTVTLPEDLLARSADREMQQLQARLDKSHFTMELYCQANSTTPEQLRAGYRQAAEVRMRSMLAVRAIAQAENINALNEEVDAEYARLARQHDTPEEEIRRVLTRDAVAAAIVSKKVQRFLIDHADVTTVTEE